MFLCSEKATATPLLALVQCGFGVRAKEAALSHLGPATSTSKFPPCAEPAAKLLRNGRGMVAPKNVEVIDFVCCELLAVENLTRPGCGLLAVDNIICAVCELLAVENLTCTGCGLLAVEMDA